MLRVCIIFFLSLLLEIPSGTSGRSDITSITCLTHSFASSISCLFGFMWGRFRFMEAMAYAAILQTGSVTSIRSLSSTVVGVLGAGPVNEKWTNTISLLWDAKPVQSVNFQKYLLLTSRLWYDRFCAEAPILSLWLWFTLFWLWFSLCLHQLLLLCFVSKLIICKARE